MASLTLTLSTLHKLKQLNKKIVLYLLKENSYVLVLLIMYAIHTTKTTTDIAKGPSLPRIALEETIGTP